MFSFPAALAPILKPLGPQMRLLVQYSLFVNLLVLASPLFIRQVYDRVVFHAGMSTLQALVIGMTVAIGFDYVLRQARSGLMQRVSLRVDAALGRRLYEKLSALPLRTLEARPAAFWQGLFRDAEQVRNMVGGPNAVLLSDLPFVLLFIGLIFLIAAPVVWVLVAALGAFLVLAWWSSRAVQDASRVERDAGLARDALIGEIVAGRATMKALAVGEAIRPVWEDRHAGSIEAALRRGGRADMFANMGVALNVLTTVAMTVVGALAILDHRMTIGALIAASLLSVRVIAPLNQLVAAWRSFATCREAANRLSEVLALPEERSASEVAFDRPAGNLAMEDVTFRYVDTMRPVVDRVALTLRPGGLHGIVGRNGSGKSTLLKLMQGLYVPDTGRVLLDGADIRQFTRIELARWIGYVSQECVLFAGTIRDNIAKRMPDASDDDVLAVARLVGAHEDIVDLPAGYNTDIGEAGGLLSAGQRQKLVIARALLGEPPVLLLDEPTSNLDRPAEEKLRNLLLRLAADRNVVVVTHSPILLSACNNLIVLDKGRIAMAGSAAEVMPRLFGGQGTPPPLERKV